MKSLKNLLKEEEKDPEVEDLKMISNQEIGAAKIAISIILHPELYVKTVDKEDNNDHYIYFLFHLSIILYK